MCAACRRLTCYSAPLMTLWMEEVEQRMEQLPGAVAEALTE